MARSISNLRQILFGVAGCSRISRPENQTGQRFCSETRSKPLRMIFFDFERLRLMILHLNHKEQSKSMISSSQGFCSRSFSQPSNGRNTNKNERDIDRCVLKITSDRISKKSGYSDNYHLESNRSISKNRLLLLIIEFPFSNAVKRQVNSVNFNCVTPLFFHSNGS
jgi:hypothetical protein